MSPVGGSRHYGGPGLGDVGVWRCPSCGADNAGPLPQGCQLCGAGKPGAVPTPPPAPEPPARRYEPRSTYELGDPPAPEPAAAPEYRSGSTPLPEMNEYQAWVMRHPDATLEQAFIAGYVDGIRAARRAQLDEERRRQPPAREVLAPEAKRYRTLVAALSYFRDQFLAGNPEEVRTGEWLTYEEANAVIAQIQTALAGVQEGEAYAVHAR